MAWKVWINKTKSGALSYVVYLAYMLLLVHTKYWNMTLVMRVINNTGKTLTCAQ